MYRSHPYQLLLVALVIGFASGSELQADQFDYDGGVLFLNNCSNCHGLYGEGDGAVSPSLSVVVQDLRYLSARNDGEYPARFVERIVDGREMRLAHGPEGMPVWGEVFAVQEGFDESAQTRVSAKITSIVEFLESIQVEQ